jgi:acetyl esterase/lipase
VIPDSIRPTLSADYRAFETLIRLNAISEDDPLKDARIIINNLRSTFMIDTVVPKPAECEITNELFEHDGHIVNTYWVNNNQREFQKHTDQIIIFFHGGGYIMGNIHSKLLSYICD